MTYHQQHFYKAREIWYSAHNDDECFARFEHEHINVIDAVVALDADVAGRYALWLDRRAA